LLQYNIPYFSLSLSVSAPISKILTQKLRRLGSLNEKVEEGDFDPAQFCSGEEFTLTHTHTILHSQRRNSHHTNPSLSSSSSNLSLSLFLSLFSGTMFMDRLKTSLCYYCCHHLALNPRYKNVTMLVSGKCDVMRTHRERVDRDSYLAF
jgi:hypothetical protein